MRDLPAGKVKLVLTGVLLLAGGVGVVSANADSSGSDDSSGAAIGTAVTEPAPAEEDSLPDDHTDLPAPAGSSPGVWWRPGANNFSASMVWVFDPSTNSGYQKEYQPTGIDGPFQYQHTFTYGSIDSGVRLSFLSLTGINPLDEDLTSLSYDRSDGVLLVDRDGDTESWFGCSSEQMPALAAVLC